MFGAIQRRRRDKARGCKLDIVTHDSGFVGLCELFHDFSIEPGLDWAEQSPFAVVKPFLKYCLKISSYRPDICA
jgi:hypothetical protein